MHEPTPNIASLTIDHYIFLVNKCSLKWAKNWSRDSISEYASLLQYFVVYFVQVLPSSIASIITRTWDRLMVSVAVTSLIRGIFTWRSARTSVDTVISIQLRRHGADMLYTCAMYVWNNAYLSTLLCPNSGLDIGNYTLHGADGCINHQAKDPWASGEAASVWRHVCGADHHQCSHMAANHEVWWTLDVEVTVNMVKHGETWCNNIKQLHWY